jgi:hypothetical protein
MANSDWSHTKTFYKRICTTFGDNAIHRLRQREGLHRRGDHYTANIQRDSWEILNGTAEDKESMESFISRCSTKWEKVDLSSLDEEISKAEVESAIAACKGGGMRAGQPGQRVVQRSQICTCTSSNHAFQCMHG